MIKFDDVSISYNGNTILKDITFDVNSGEKVLVSGKSGIGKSSLLKAILGFIDFSGKILIDDIKVDTVGIQKIRRVVAYMPQEINMPISSINEFISFSTTWNSSQNHTKKNTLELLEKFNIAPDLLEKKLSEISGGQKQRIILATCLAQDKPFLLLDEPDSSMDAENRKIIREYLMGLQKSVLLISHDLEWGNYVDKTLNLDGNG